MEATTSGPVARGNGRQNAAEIAVNSVCVVWKTHDAAGGGVALNIKRTVELPCQGHLGAAPFKSASDRLSAANRHHGMHHRAGGPRAYVEPPTKLAREGLHSGDAHAKIWLLHVICRRMLLSDALTVIGYHEVQPLTETAELDGNT